MNNLIIRVKKHRNVLKVNSIFTKYKYILFKFKLCINHYLMKNAEKCWKKPENPKVFKNFFLTKNK